MARWLGIVWLALLACDEVKPTSDAGPRGIRVAPGTSGNLEAGSSIGVGAAGGSGAASGAAAAGAAAARPEEGCLRSGSIEGVENDPTCVIHKPTEEGMRAFIGGDLHQVLKRVSITCSLEQAEVISGLSTPLHVTFVNTASTESVVVFEARPRPDGPRPDLSRVAGIPELRPVAVAPKLFFPISTTDARDRDVDALPTVNAPPATTTTLGVHLRPGAKLVYSTSWHALSIPAPAPIFHDDAGHRYVPKTMAQPLPPGEYNVVVDVPLYGLSKEERKVVARVKVVRPPALDGGPARPW